MTPKRLIDFYSKCADWIVSAIVRNTQTCSDGAMRLKLRTLASVLESDQDLQAQISVSAEQLIEASYRMRDTQSPLFSRTSIIEGGIQNAVRVGVDLYATYDPFVQIYVLYSTGVATLWLVCGDFPKLYDELTSLLGFPENTKGIDPSILKQSRGLCQSSVFNEWPYTECFGDISSVFSTLDRRRQSLFEGPECKGYYAISIVPQRNRLHGEHTSLTFPTLSNSETKDSSQINADDDDDDDQADPKKEKEPTPRPLKDQGNRNPAGKKGIPPPQSDLQPKSSQQLKKTTSPKISPVYHDPNSTGLAISTQDRQKKRYPERRIGGERSKKGNSSSKKTPSQKPWYRRLADWLSSLFMRTTPPQGGGDAALSWWERVLNWFLPGEGSSSGHDSDFMTALKLVALILILLLVLALFAFIKNILF